MNKTRTLGLMVFVLVSFCTVAATSAFAAPEWLIGGAAVTALTSVQAIGLLTLTDLEASFLGASAIDCIFRYVGSVGAAGEDEITEIVDGHGNVSTSSNQPLGPVSLDCPGVQGCEGEGLVWPIGLPWLTQLELENASIIDDTKASGELGYAIECSIFGIKEEDTCSQGLLALAFIENMATENDTLWSVSEENRGRCSLSGKNTLDIQGELLISPLTGTLAVSGE